MTSQAIVTVAAKENLGNDADALVLALAASGQLDVFEARDGAAIDA